MSPASRRRPAKRALSDYRKTPAPAIPQQRRALPVFRPDEWVMGFDQSLANTGWSIVSTDSAGKPHVIKTGMIKTEPTHLKSFADTFLRLETIWDQMVAVMTEFQPPVVVHEMPALWGKRTDSSLVAAVTLRLAARTLGVPMVMVHNNSMKRVVVGKPQASKAEVKAGVKSLAPDVVNCRPANEHTYDSVALALFHLKR